MSSPRSRGSLSPIRSSDRSVSERLRGLLLQVSQPKHSIACPLLIQRLVRAESSPQDPWRRARASCGGIGGTEREARPANGPIGATGYSICTELLPWEIL